MEAVVLHGSIDKSMSPYKSHIRSSPKKINQFDFQTRGLLQAPRPFLSHSYPPYNSQPPLLPLPAANPRRSAALSRGLSCPPPANKKPNKNRDSPVTPKKSKSPKKQEQKNNNNSSRKFSLNLVVSSSAPLGPDPNELPKGDPFSGSVAFTMVSPPPSSLPLPTFSLRPKLSCNAEAAAGIDAGATDDLRRLLRLR